MVFFPFFQRSSSQRDRLPWVAALTLGVMGLWSLEAGVTPTPAMAQTGTSLASCEAPGPNEYLLLVALQTEAAQGKLAETLPPSVKAPLCDYLGSRVARMGGFKTPADADAWASYLREVAALPAFVAKPTQNRSAASTTVASAAGIQDPANFATATRSSAQSNPTVSTTGPARITEIASPGSTVSVPPLDMMPPPVLPSQSRLGARVDVPRVNTSTSGPTASGPTAAIQPVLPQGAGASAPQPSPAPAPAVSSPALSVAPKITAQAPKTPAAGTFSVSTYTPDLLSEGYVVLVDYGNQTSLAPLLQQLTKRPVGLASYGQRPFLMVNYTPDSQAALATLKTLDKSGFRTMLVNGARVTLLAPEVQVK